MTQLTVFSFPSFWLSHPSGIDVSTSTSDWLQVVDQAKLELEDVDNVGVVLAIEVSWGTDVRNEAIVPSRDRLQSAYLTREFGEGGLHIALSKCTKRWASDDLLGRDWNADRWKVELLVLSAPAISGPRLAVLWVLAAEGTLHESLEATSGDLRWQDVGRLIVFLETGQKRATKIVFWVGIAVGRGLSGSLRAIDRVNSDSVQSGVQLGPEEQRWVSTDLTARIVFTDERLQGLNVVVVALPVFAKLALDRARFVIDLFQKIEEIMIGELT